MHMANCIIHESEGGRVDRTDLPFLLAEVALLFCYLQIHRIPNEVFTPKAKKIFSCFEFGLGIRFHC